MTQPHRATPTVDPRKLARWVRRAALPIAILGALAFWWCFGAIRVPAGMDTMPTIQAGSLCLVDKRCAKATVGSEVFVDLPDGSTLLSRIVSITPDDRLVLANDNADSQLPDSKNFGPLPRAAIRGIVLTAFLPDVPTVPPVCAK